MATINRWVALALLLLVAGCSSYPAATSAESLKLVAALRTACAGKLEANLARIEKQAIQAHEQGKLSPAERDALARIVQLAREGRWEQAEAACLAFQKAQKR
jgi:hypothetical protein